MTNPLTGVGGFSVSILAVVTKPTLIHKVVQSDDGWPKRINELGLASPWFYGCSSPIYSSVVLSFPPNEFLVPANKHVECIREEHGEERGIHRRWHHHSENKDISPCGSPIKCTWNNALIIYNDNMLPRCVCCSTGDRPFNDTEKYWR